MPRGIGDVRVSIGPLEHRMCDAQLEHRTVFLGMQIRIRIADFAAKLPQNTCMLLVIDG